MLYIIKDRLTNSWSDEDKNDEAILSSNIRRDLQILRRLISVKNFVLVFWTLQAFLHYDKNDIYQVC